MSVDNRSYRDAITHLEEVVSVLNRPGEGMGVAWGLRRGQAGWFAVVNARNMLEKLRDDLVRLDDRDRIDA
jgi:hypothetical protein